MNIPDHPWQAMLSRILRKATDAGAIAGAHIRVQQTLVIGDSAPVDTTYVVALLRPRAVILDGVLTGYTPARTSEFGPDEDLYAMVLLAATAESLAYKEEVAWLELYLPSERLTTARARRDAAVALVQELHGLEASFRVQTPTPTPTPTQEPPQ